MVGGTHGNEPTGIYLLHKWEKDKKDITRENFNTSLLFANHDAAKNHQRFIEKDLNRCFLANDLCNKNLCSCEDLRAKEINMILGPKGHSKYDLIIDMHTTTTNMGITLICDTDPCNLKIAGKVKQKIPEVNIYCFDKSDRILSCLRSITPYGIGIEIGPVPQNILRHDIINRMELTVSTILDVVNELNANLYGRINLQTEVYYHLDDVRYPEQKPSLNYVIHKYIEGKDYQELRIGDPIFVAENGGEIRYNGQDSVYPVFINEAAYYEKKIAFSITQKRYINLV